MHYDCDEAHIERGELLFLYTDGLVEARVDGVVFGEESLLALFAEPGMDDAETAVSRVVAAVVEFADGRLSDDLALLAIAPADSPIVER
jgi:sigma-B regulation protein RsbU (phosphoserine phosphatase)